MILCFKVLHDVILLREYKLIYALREFAIYNTFLSLTDFSSLSVRKKKI